jgi:hypothetical protein
LNNESLLTHSLVKPGYNFEKFWRLVDCLLMVTYITLLIHFAKIC